MRLNRILLTVAVCQGALAQQDFLTVYGTSHDVSSLGASVIGAGDVDLDGTPDIAAQAYDHGDWVVLVFSGANGSLLRRYEGTATSGGFGFAMVAGDIDDDDRVDLVIGDHTEGTGGAVRAFSGADGSVLWTTTSVGQFGRSVAVVDDLDSDGMRDVLVGAPDDQSGPGKGRFAVLSGATGIVFQSVFAEQDVHGLGHTVCDVGDADGDGVSDYVVSLIWEKRPEPWVMPDFTNLGAARLYSGASGNLLFEWVGNSTDEHLGRSLAGPGDLNGDGRADVLIGAPGDDLGGFRSGSVFAFSGLDGARLRTHVGEAPNQEFGTRIAILGDVDGDGFTDYGVSAPLDDAFGKDSGSVWVFSGYDALMIQRTTGDGPSLNWGAGLAGVGDVDGDRLDDWVGGAPTDHPAHQKGGYARIYVAN